MSAPQEPLKLTPEAFEETARAITYQWMQHVGHGYEDVEAYERQLDADLPVDEDDPNHDALREFEDTSEFVVFVMEQLVSLAEFTATERRRARDDAAELRAAIREWVEATDDAEAFELDQTNAYGTDHADAEDRVEAAVKALRALAASEGSAE